MDTPVTPDNREEIILCGTQIDEEVGTEVNGGIVEKLVFCIEACPRLEEGPNGTESEILGEDIRNRHLMGKSEDAAHLRVAQNVCVTLEQTFRENVNFRKSVELQSTCFEDISEGNTVDLTSKIKEESNTVLQEWESGEADKCRSPSVA